MQKRKGFTLVELVIVIAVIAILAGVLIGTFASVINRANESAKLQELKAQEIEQKADDIIKKIEDADWFGWEDFETSVVAQLTKAYREYGTSSTGLTEQQVKDALQVALVNYGASKTSDMTSLTEAQVKAIVENALGTLKLDGVTEAQVKTIISEATTSVLGKQLTEAQVKAVVEAANAKNLTAAQVSAALAQELKGVTTVTDLETKLNAAVAALDSKIAATAITDKAIAALIEDLVPVTVPVDTEAAFSAKVASLNSGSTIVWTGAETAELTLSTTEVKTLTIKGKMAKLTIDAAKATVYVLDDVTDIEVTAVADNSLHIFGVVKTLKVSKGRAVLESGAKVTETLTAAPDINSTVTIEIEKGAVVEQLDAVYQTNGNKTNDYIEIANNGTVNKAELGTVDGWTKEANTTNVRVVNGEGSKGTSVEKNDIAPVAETEITVVEDNASSTYKATTVDNETTYVPTTTTTNASFWGTLYATSFAAGSGSSMDPYQISNAAELVRLSWLVLNTPNGYSNANVYYVLTDNIDLTGSTWMPISAYSRNIEDNRAKWFAGHFDGRGYTITGVNDNKLAEIYHNDLAAKNKSTVANADGEYTFGLFGSVYGATIENVIVDVNLTNVSFTSGGKTYVGDSVGGLVGFAEGAVNISNIVVNGTIKGTDGVAGIVGRMYNKTASTAGAVISNCVNNASITAINHAEWDTVESGKDVHKLGYAHAAGILGYVSLGSGSVTLSDNTNNGNIYVEVAGTPYVGQIYVRDGQTKDRLTSSNNVSNGTYSYQSDHNKTAEEY